MRPCALAHLTAPFGEIAINGPARGAQQISGLDCRLAGIVGGEGRLRSASITRTNGLVDIDVVSNCMLELAAGAETGFASPWKVFASITSEYQSRGTWIH